MSPALSIFEQRMAEHTATFCREIRGEDAEGQKQAMSRYWRAFRDEMAVQVHNAGGDPGYLPDDDAIEEFIGFAMGDAVDAEAIRNERAVA